MRAVRVAAPSPSKDVLAVSNDRLDCQYRRQNADRDRRAVIGKAPDAMKLQLDHAESLRCEDRVT